jgi:nicotinamidase/pyrazinamidase
MNTVFLDIDTQLDFICPAGALYANGAEVISENLRTLTRYAASNRIQVISTADAHAEDDPEFAIWKPHCVLGTAGQQKLAGTVLDNRYVLSTPETRLEPGVARGFAQIIIEKQTVDCLTIPNFLPLLQALGADHLVLYGLVTEVCVLNAARGLLRNGYSTEVVTDSIHAFSTENGEKALGELADAGAKLTTTARVLA